MRRPVDILMIAAIAGVVGFLIVMTIPRQRETARATRCRDNLRQIGVGLAIEAQNGGRLPAIPELGKLENPEKPGPLATLLGDLGRPDLTGLKLAKKPEPRAPGPPPSEHRIGGFLCPSDPAMGKGGAPASISYRAAAGSSVDGSDGPFSPGQIVTTDRIARGDGLEFTAAFAERLIGSGEQVDAELGNYQVSSRPIAGPPWPELTAETWRGDAGSSWAVADWRSTLYNHALAPNAAGSRIAIDGKTALMGASSGHGPFVHVLTFDGSVRPVTDRVDLKIWRGLADLGDSKPPQRQE